MSTSHTMKAAQFKTQGGPLEIVQVPIPNPSNGQVRIKVLACGVCHSDVAPKYGFMGNSYPRIPGHEVIGIVDEIGANVHDFKKGELVGVGWFGGHCGECNSCKKNAWVSCDKGQVCGVSYDGGYAEYLVAPHDALAKVPEGLTPEEAAPLMCAGITTFNALKNSAAKAGELVVVQGVGGLGHLGIQFARKMGFEIAALSNGKAKEELAKKLGAHHYIDSTDSAAAVKKIQELGGAKVVLITAPSAKLAEDLLPALGQDGQMLIVAVLDQPLKVNTLSLLLKRQSILVWASGDSRDSEQCMHFSATQGVKPMTESFPLDKAEEAFQYMLANKARFRCVLKISDHGHHH